MRDQAENCQSETGCWAPAKAPLHEMVDGAGIRVAATLGVGLNRLRGSRAGDQFGILMYHRIAPEVSGAPKPTLNVTPRQFRRQIRGLLDRGFVFWPLRKVLQMRAAGQTIPPRVTVVTFDDGFGNVHKYAWPVLREWRVPATVFVNTAYVDSDEPFPFDHWGVANRDLVSPEAFRPLRTWQCREMIDDGLMEIGAHTHTHEDFRGRPEVFQRDLVQCVETVRSLFGMDDVTFAFPYGTPQLGFASEDLVEAAKATGVTCGLTTESELVDWRDDPFRWGRFNAFPWDNGATLAAKLDGWYSWAPQGRRRLVAALRRAKRSVWGMSSCRSREASRERLALESPSLYKSGYESKGRGDRQATEKTATPYISVVVPTYNRAHWLGEALRSLAGQITDDSFSYELVVVDNASTDATRQVVEDSRRASAIPIQYVYQATAGDAPARNAGIEVARGDWLAFFDDDQLAEPDWLRELFETAYVTGASIVGGPVHLDLPESELNRLGPICRQALREVTFYSTLHPYVNKDLPGTGNALVKREVIDHVGVFDVSMTAGGSDTDFFFRAREAGYPLWYTPRAIIRHRIPPNRLTPDYFRWEGLSSGAGHCAHFDFEQKGRLTMLLMCGVRIAHAVLVNLPLMLLAWSRGNEGEALGRKMSLWRAEGYARKTLAVLSPWLFPQRRFFESLEFRAGRVIGQSHVKTPTQS